MNRKPNILAVILISVTITTCSSVYGQSTDWVGGGGNNFFSNGLNWSDGVPGPADAANFLQAAPPVINVIVDEQIRRLFSRNSVDLTLSGPVNFVVDEDITASRLSLINQIAVDCGSLYVADIQSLMDNECNVNNATVDAGEVRVGSHGFGLLQITNGGVVTSTVGSFVFNGLISVSGNSSELIAGQELRIGIGQIDANVDVLSGGFVSAEEVLIGFNGLGNGCVDVDGNLSELFCGGNMQIGVAAPGELNISDFGKVTVLDDVDVAADSSVSISDNGVLDVSGELINEGMVSFSGSGTVEGDICNETGGELMVGPNGLGNILGNLVHDGAEIFVASTGQLLVCGDWSGSGQFTGNGRVDFEMGVRPGGFETSSVSFEGDVYFGSDVQAGFQIGGVTGSQYDWMYVDDDLSLDGSLNVTLVNGFSLQPGMLFRIFLVGNSRTGTFDGLPEGALVGNFGGIDLFITYSGGDGNEVELFTENFVLGDANDDGEFNNFDIASFVLALTNITGYQAMFPNVDPDVVLDMNGDGGFDNLDIAAFVMALTG